MLLGAVRFKKWIASHPGYGITKKNGRCVLQEAV